MPKLSQRKKMRAKKISNRRSYSRSKSRRSKYSRSKSRRSKKKLKGGNWFCSVCRMEKAQNEFFPKEKRKGKKSCKKCAVKQLQSETHLKCSVCEESFVRRHFSVPQRTRGDIRMCPVCEALMAREVYEKQKQKASSMKLDPTATQFVPAGAAGGGRGGGAAAGGARLPYPVRKFKI